MRSIVTEWFRTPRVWRHLASSMAQMPAPVTVWSGACGAGQEAYSAAMLCAATPALRDARVIASDISPGLIAAAKVGRYSAADVHHDVAEGRLTRQQVSRFLRRQGTGYRPAPELRRRVSFTVGRVGVDRPPPCHVALLRNVWRHLAPDEQAQAAADLHATIPAHGLLVLGGGDLLDEAALRAGRVVDIRPAGLVEHFEESAEHELIWRPL